MADLMYRCSSRTRRHLLWARPRSHAVHIREAGQGTGPTARADEEGIRQQTAPAARTALRFSDSHRCFLPENALRSEAIVGLHCDLQAHFHCVRHVVVEGNMFIYKDPSDIRRIVASDVLVVLDHDLGRQPTYKLWDEGEYSLFQPDPNSSRSQLTGYQLWGRKYAEICQRSWAPDGTRNRTASVWAGRNGWKANGFECEIWKPRTTSNGTRNGTAS